ncbi:MAG: SPOR domain-containing protein, partial [Flavobacteriales bacterium]
RAYLQRNPEGTAYLSWLAPNWRLRVGDCRTRLEAERLLRDVKAQYPGSYIVPDEIEMPR